MIANCLNRHCYKDFKFALTMVEASPSVIRASFFATLSGDEEFRKKDIANSVACPDIFSGLKRPVLILLILFFITNNAFSQELNTAIFKNPPKQYKPKTWMHAMSGNMSAVGMTKDLEAISKVGIGGVLLFNVTHLIPNGNVKFNSDEHLTIIKHAAQECERLGLSFGVHNCDGWTSSGGPWVTPDNSMKMLVQSEVVVNGGKATKVKLPQPTTRKGFYKDVVVLAYPALASEIKDFENKPKVTSNDPKFNTQLATDGRLDEETTLVGTEKKEAWIQFEYKDKFTISKVEMALEKTIAGNGEAFLWKSEDGLNFTKVQTLKIKRMAKREFGFEDILEPLTAKYFRISIKGTFELMEVKLKSDGGISDLMARKSMFKEQDVRLKSLLNPANNLVISKSSILNLSANLLKDGTLNINLPKGKWTILRFGYTTTGYENGPASREGTGLEIDKMSKKALKVHFDAYVGKVISKVKSVAPNALQYLEIDSYEVGGQNWTDDFDQIFKEKFGYDLISFLPIYAGKFVESAKATESVFDDIRYLNSNLITNNYFKYFNELCHNNGLISYVEPYSINGPFNELDAAKYADIPMGEFWLHQRYVTPTAVSGSRIYGKNVVSAESFSAQSDINWKGHPGSLKTTGDKAWTLGINEFMFHRYAHQPNINVLPGMTMSMFGTHMDRTQTWWYNAGEAWFKYLARGQYLLRQGNPVSDLLVFVGDGTPNSSFDKNQMGKNFPDEVNFDCINANALVNRIDALNANLVLPNGISYKALMLTNTKKIRLMTLEKLAVLSKKGIIIIGDKPQMLIGYQHTKEQQDKFIELVNAVWNSPKTYIGNDIASVFKSNSILPDLKLDNPIANNYIHRKTSDTDIYFFQNTDSVAKSFNCSFRLSGKIPELWDAKTGETIKLADFSFDEGRTNIKLDLDSKASVFVVFRNSADGFNPIKNFNTSANDKVSTTINNKGDLIFETFSNGDYNFTLQNGRSIDLAVNNLPKPISINQNWEVDFKNEIDKPFHEKFAYLIDWKDAKKDEVKYFSGTANYKRNFMLDKSVLKEGNKITLDLGKVSISARVILNGTDLGVLWVSPYKIDITKFVKSGSNNIELQVANLWTNKLIGDERFPRTDGYNINNPKMPDWYMNNLPMPVSERTTFTTYEFYKKTDPLISSGLLGPVSLNFSKTIFKTN